LFLEGKFLFKTFLVAEKPVFPPRTFIPELGSTFTGIGTGLRVEFILKGFKDSARGFNSGIEQKNARPEGAREALL
jgi:hypothetical protein